MAKANHGAMMPPVLQTPTVEPLQLSQRLTAALRALPDFLVLGAEDAGMTALLADLGAHPQIAPALARDVHFFDRHYELGANWYRARFPTYWASWRGGLVAGEASADYMFYPRTPARVREVIPDAQLIVLLCNPVERALAHYEQQVKLGLETLSFEDALAFEATRLSGEYEKLASDGSYSSFNYQHYSYLARGMYANQLARWFKFFEREQFLILSDQPSDANPERNYLQVLEFLGVADAPSSHVRVENRKVYQPMAEDTREWLTAFFAPHNAELYELLGQDFGWLES